ncbi:MAG: HD domain-containing phosphohydrolase [Candidatus Omnitrophota bacterium]
MRLPQKRRSIKSKIMNVVILSIFLISAVLGYAFFAFSKMRIERMMGDSAKGVAATTANFISGKEMDLIAKNSDTIWERYRAARESEAGLGRLAGQKTAVSDPGKDISSITKLYTDYIKILGRVKELNKLESPITVYMKKKNALAAILSSDETLLLGATFVMRKEAKAVLKSGLPGSTKIYRDKDGSWISAYAPITYGSNRKTIGIIEINQKMDIYIRHLYRALAAIVVLCLACLVGVSIASYPLVNKLVGDINRLDSLANYLQDEKYDVAIDVESDDEIGHLAETFEHLRLAIRDKIQKLKAALRREKHAHLESIIALTNTIELRDPYTRGHVHRVEKYALLIAKALKLSREQVERLKYSCFLHDVGKIDIELSLLRKKEKLTNAEFEIIKTHSEKGAQVVEGIKFLADVKDIILYHQERYDGKGYPKGLKGEAIPLLARIVSVADTFDAMTTDRPYSPKMPFVDAIEELEAHSGTQFDPNIVNAFLKYRNSLEKMTDKHFKRLGVIAQSDTRG